jgi:putative cardiolipin synthase
MRLSQQPSSAHGAARFAESVPPSSPIHPARIPLTKWRRFHFHTLPARLVVLLFWCAWLAGCALAPVENRTLSSALGNAQSHAAWLGQTIVPQTVQHPGKSGIDLLQNPHDAFAARILLAQTAERTLDVQYYIWHDDLAGTLLLKSLRAAAERGVRVRLLLDDNGTTGLDRELAALEAHPNIEVRLFNPFVPRHPKWLGYPLPPLHLNSLTTQAPFRVWLVTPVRPAQ